MHLAYYMYVLVNEYLVEGKPSTPMDEVNVSARWYEVTEAVLNEFINDIVSSLIYRSIKVKRRGNYIMILTYKITHS